MIQRCAKPGSRFTWHDAAQLVAPDGARFGPETRDGAGLPGALFAEAAAGRAFAMTPRGLEAAACGAQPAFECETSGSTGTPKRIRRSQASWLASFAINRRFPIAALRAEARPFSVRIGESHLGHDAMRGELAGAGHQGPLTSRRPASR